MSPTTLIQVDESALRSKIASLRTEEPQEAKATLDSATAYLAQLSLAMKTFWNELVAPISTLPPELLARILIEAVDKDSPEENTRIDWEKRVELSTVCKMWREAALDSPAYWAGVRLSLHCANLMEMLPRWKGHARAVTIKLGVDCMSSISPSSIPEHLLDLVIPNGIASFEVFSSSPSQYTMLWEVLPKGWNSTCHTLRIVGTKHIQRLLGPVSIPAHIILDTNGGLRHLILDLDAKYRVDWKALEAGQVNVAFKNLRTLKLARLDPPPSSTLLNNILSSTQHLERLTIIKSLPGDFTPTFDLATFESSLVDLSLEGPLEVISRLFIWIMASSALNRLRCIQLYGMSFRHSDIPRPTEPLQPLVSKVFSSFSAFVNRSHQALRGKTLVLSHQSSHFSIKLEDPDAVVDRSREPDDPILFIDCVRPHFDPKHFPLLDSCNIPQVEALRLEIEPAIFNNCPQDVWVRFFHRHRNLTTLQLTGLHLWEASKTRAFFRLLSPPHLIINGEPVLSPDISDHHVLLPNLEKLLILRTQVTYMCSVQWGLRDMMVARWKSGSPIALVEFGPCTFVAVLDYTLLTGSIPAQITRIVANVSGLAY